MVLADKIESKIYSLDALAKRIEFWRMLGDRIVFTNGCFDILHQGHVHLLAGCSAMGDRLIIGLNSDASVKRLKGEKRPVNQQDSRAIVLASNLFTDGIVVFEEDTPENLIHAIKPDVLVKGGDWQKDNIVGASFVESYGGIVTTIPYLNGFSTTGILERC